MNVRCGFCFKDMMIVNATETIKCPICTKDVIIVDPKGKTLRYAEGVQPAWKQPVGYMLFWIGIAAFVATFFVGGNRESSFDQQAGVLSALLNPLGWIGVITGVIWGNFNRSKPTAKELTKLNDQNLDNNP
ncbi:MAG: hypothetical protein JNJ77_19280 [Planctomycetia bacterium]|nr:hypothetical protein [Planctomycetia bacterium]